MQETFKRDILELHRDGFDFAFITGAAKTLATRHGFDKNELLSLIPNGDKHRHTQAVRFPPMHHHL